jgi:hypothetical protein
MPFTLAESAEAPVDGCPDGVRGRYIGQMLTVNR